MLTKRAEILFDPKEYDRLKEVAKKERKSVGSLIRDAIRRIYLVHDQAEKKAAVKWIISQKMDFEDWETEKNKIIRSRVRAAKRNL